MSVAMISEQQYQKVYNSLLESEFLPYDNRSKLTLENKIKELRRLNHDSYNKRYNESFNYISFEPVESHDRSENYNKYKNRYQLLKSIECILYNCNKEINEKAYNYFERIKLIIMKDIIEDIKEYKKAEWMHNS